MPYALDTAHWFRTGCHLHHDCLTCPLPQCIFDTEQEDGRHNRSQLTRTTERLELARRLRDAGGNSQTIGLSLGISRRSAYRLLLQLQKEGR